MKKPSDITKIVLKKSKKAIFIRFVTSLIYRGLAMIIPILFSLAVDNATDGIYDKAIIMSIVSIFVVIIFRTFDVICTYSWHKMYNSMYDNYTKIGINKVFDNSLYSLSRFNIGEFLNIMSTDINVMSDFYCNLVMRLIRVFEVLIIFVYFFMIDLYIGFAGVLMALISLSIIFLSSKKVEKLNQIKSIDFDNRNTIVNEFLVSIREIKVFNIFKTMSQRINDSTKKYTVSFLRQRVGEDIFKFSVLMLIEVSRWCLFLYGIYLISIGKMEIGTLLIIYNYFTQLVDGFSEFATINIGIRQLKVSEKRFFQLIIYSHDKLLENKNYNFDKFNIKFEDVVYGNKNDPRIKNASFKLNGNSINTIVGAPGSGKSGVVDLLLKLNSKHTGTITIDDVRIEDIDFNYYYKMVSSIDKNDKFLNISVKDNLNIVNSNFNHALYICQKLGVHDDILKLKDGYDTILNSNDDTLKKNSKVLLNITRILLKDTRIMIFDEILYSLDNESRNKVFEVLDEIKNEHTIIIIDKKIDVLKKSDNIILLNDGCIISSGIHDQLLNNKLYKQIIEK